MDDIIVFFVTAQWMALLFMLSFTLLLNVNCCLMVEWPFFLAILWKNCCVY